MRLAREFDWDGFAALSNKARWSAGGVKSGAVEAMERAESVIWHCDDLSLAYSRLDEILRFSRAEEDALSRRGGSCDRVREFNAALSAVLALFGE